MRYIYITGCAKSGTTMLLGLFHAFNYPCIPIECYARQLVVHGQKGNSRYGGIVGKRVKPHIFSNLIPRKTELAQLNLIVKNGIEIVHMTRNKEDVLRSFDRYVPEERYEAVRRQAEEHSHVIKCHVRFEDILEYPLEVQYQLAKELELEIVHPWTEYPDFVPSMVNFFAEWPPRPIGAPKEDYA